MKIQVLTACILLFGSSITAQIITNYTTADGLLADNVNCVDVDANDAIWFGTQSGVSVLNGSIWTNYTTATAPGLVDNTIQAIFVTASGDVWVGTDFGASVYDGTNWTSYTTADGLGNNQIKCITEDAIGRIWFGTNSGASLFNGTTWTNYSTANGLPFGGINEIEVLANGDVWMGTGLSGVSIFNGSVFSSINTTDGLIDNRIRSIIVDPSGGNKWVGTSEGITVFNSSNAFSMNHTSMFSLPAPDTLNPIEDLEISSQGIIWVGIYVDYLVTEGGVCAFNGINWNEYKVADGLVGPVVRALAIDGNGDVWVATSTGVSQISDPSVQVGELGETTFSMYPNPTSDQVTIRVPINLVSEDLVMYDASMKVIKRETISTELMQFSLEELMAGIYFVQIGSTVERLIVR